MKIEVENQIIAFHTQYGSRKKLSIHIEPNGQVIVKVPNGTSEETIASAVRHHGAAILKQLEALAKAREVPKLHDYQEEGKFLHLGRFYALHELIETEGRDEDELRMSLKKFYFANCKQIISERLKIYQAQMKVKAKSFDIVESVTKWGSCSSDRKLTFNYRLAMAPVDVIDYVVVHELSHLTHMNHDRSFWRLVGSIMPDYKAKEAYLARYGQAMTL
ncbi:M48 family metallopeptidase [Paenibacillus phyllosphaerae]|nr:SprT family zinc-dependent metalloprotease [Paenibacillus phyllosphaerae]